MRYITRRFAPLASLLLLAGLVGFAAAPAAQAATPPYGPGNPFWTYTGSTPLGDIAPGTVLKSRTLSYWGLWWPVTTHQLLYRSTDVQGRPTANMTSVLEPTGGTGPTRAVAYGMAYDSLNPLDEPSVLIAEGQSVGSDVSSLLSSGVTVIIPDTEGQSADMTEGREYGMNTLDAIRAATNFAASGLNHTTPVALMGYSGGAWSTEWAAQLAPSYAPDVNSQLVGAAIGGVPVDAAHIARYLSGSANFSAELPVALIGMSRAYGVDFTPYLSDAGKAMIDDLHDASLATAISKYHNVTISQMFKPQYADPNSVPGYVDMINQENLGLVPPATIPLYIVQGNSGWIDGTPAGPPGIGDGDGATVTGDVRTLARQACGAGTPVSYNEIGWLDHLGADVPWSSGSRTWIADRFNGVAAPNTCASIPAGNSLAAEQPAAAAIS